MDPMKHDPAGEVGDAFKELAPMGDAPVAPAHVVASIALNMAMKYHDTCMVKDGALYQQYKLEGKNMVPLHLDMVFADAVKIEAWLLGSSGRIAKLIVDALEVNTEDEPHQVPESPAPPDVTPREQTP